MKTTSLGFAIVGTGMIAGVIADALSRTDRAALRAVSSRQLATAQKFTAGRPGVEAVEGLDALLRRDDIGAVYLAIPTAAKETAALAAIAAGKHVLVEKPFLSAESVRRMTGAAAARGVLFMDATHFVHHPRTAAIRAATAERIGTPRSLHTTFYFPFSDRGNIRFDLLQEPMSALGDMAWYSMRAVAEYLRPAGSVARAATIAERDPATGAIVRAAGLIAFTSGETSTFDIGYTAGTAIMDLTVVGTKGVISLDDFVLDWTDSFAFQNPDLATGYVHRTGMATRRDAVFVATPARMAGQVAMIESFATLAVTERGTDRSGFAHSSLKTQEYLDALWQAANS